PDDLTAIVDAVSDGSGGNPTGCRGFVEGRIDPAAVKIAVRGESTVGTEDCVNPDDLTAVVDTGGGGLAEGTIECRVGPGVIEKAVAGEIVPVGPDDLTGGVDAVGAGAAAQGGGDRR